MTSPVQKACDISGSQKSLADAVGVTPATVNQWVSGKRPVPSERCIDIERITAGAVTCEELRPDLAERWKYLRGTASAVDREKPPISNRQEAA